MNGIAKEALEKIVDIGTGKVEHADAEARVRHMLEVAEEAVAALATQEQNKEYRLELSAMNDSVIQSTITRLEYELRFREKFRQR